eukprot:12358_1
MHWMATKQIITWKDNKPVLESSPLQTLRQCQYLVSGYTRKLKWIFPESVTQLLVDYCPHKYNIYAIGLNDSGEFGVGHMLPIHSFTKLESFEFVCDDCNDIYYGRSRFIIKTFGNDIYTAGTNRFGGCCTTYSLSNVTELTKINKTNLPQDSFIRSISSGLTSSHTFIISSDNKIYAFGINDNAQFGNAMRSDDSNPVLTPLHTLNRLFPSNNNKITKICTGFNHSLFLTNTGNVWSCGKNNFGQCGIVRQCGTADPLKLIPVLVPFLQNIIDIECGLMHNLCIDRAQQLWGFGYNRFGQLGFGGNKVVEKPVLNDFFKHLNVVQMSCGHSHSFVIDDDGKCWLFGRNVEGQIGIGLANWNYTGIKVPHLFQDENDDELRDLIVVDGACGYYHTIILTKQGQIYGFGSNKDHAISHEHLEQEMVCPCLVTPKEIGSKGKNETVVRIIAGHQSTIVITQ